jgi:hypothetical protein
MLAGYGRPAGAEGEVIAYGLGVVPVGTSPPTRPRRVRSRSIGRWTNSHGAIGFSALRLQHGDRLGVQLGGFQPGMPDQATDLLEIIPF